MPRPSKATLEARAAALRASSAKTPLSPSPKTPTPPAKQSTFIPTEPTLAALLSVTPPPNEHPATPEQDEEPSTNPTSRHTSPPTAGFDSHVVMGRRSTAHESGLLGLLLKHANEDLSAWRFDRDWCDHQLKTERDMSPAEIRKLKIRCMDADHEIRKCQQKIDLIHFESSTGLNPSLILGDRGAVQSFIPPSAPIIIQTTPAPIPLPTPEQPTQLTADDIPPPKRRRKADWTGDESTIKMDDENEDAGAVVTRLGFWKCRLCTSEKFLRAGPGRQPSGPCKWPLKDVAKMIAHFTEMHHEHSPNERCVELGDALHRNRGPFEYWLRRSHSLSGADGALIDECVSSLRGGTLPSILRKLSRAAASFPEQQ